MREFLRQAGEARRRKILAFNKKTSCLRDLVQELETDVRVGGMHKRRFTQLRVALEKRSPKDSKKYKDALDWLGRNYPWTRVPPRLPKRRSPPFMGVMGAPHPTRTKARMDEVIAETGQAYRTYNQGKSNSCGPTCCLIVLQLYPAIIRIQWTLGGGHFIVVVESCGKTFMVLDPAKGSVQALDWRGLYNYQNYGSWDGRMVTSYR